MCPLQCWQLHLASALIIFPLCKTIQTPIAPNVHRKIILPITTTAPANLAQQFNLCFIPAKAARSFE
jgi:hypothetical protein